MDSNIKMLCINSFDKMVWHNKNIYFNLMNSGKSATPELYGSPQHLRYTMFTLHDFGGDKSRANTMPKTLECNGYS